MIGTVPEEAKANNTTAELVISADGKFLYVGNRGHDTVAVFAIDRKTGMLTLKENIPSGGRTPRNVRIDPTGDWFFAANENGGNVTEFKIDRATRPSDADRRHRADQHARRDLFPESQMISQAGGPNEIHSPLLDT